MAKFKINDIVQIEDKALGLKAIGKIEKFTKDTRNTLYYSIDWIIVDCKKSQGIRPTSLYPVYDFDKKGSLCPAGEVLYGVR